MNLLRRVWHFIDQHLVVLIVVLFLLAIVGAVIGINQRDDVLPAARARG